MDKLLSIIIPSYNMEKFLPNCLGNLIVEDPDLLRKLDVIVVNDGSKDRTSEIAHDFERRYPGVFRVIDKPNGNYGSCVNAGLSKVAGAFVRVLDADDSLVTANLPEYLHFLEKTVCDLVITDTCEVDADGVELCRVSRDFCKSKIYSVEEILHRYYYYQLNTLTYRASVFKDFGYHQLEGVSYTDTQWSILPLVRVKTCVYFPVVTYRYLAERAGQTMGVSTLAKNYWMMGRAALDALRQYIGNAAMRESLRGEHRRMMDQRVMYFVHSVYRNVFNHMWKIPYQIDLRAFDDELMSISPEFYDMLDKVAIGDLIQCRCVANWRKNTVFSRAKLYVFLFCRQFSLAIQNHLAKCYHAVRNVFVRLWA